jgi:hypothetical protein
MRILQSIGRLLIYPTRALGRRLGAILGSSKGSIPVSGEAMPERPPERPLEHADERTIRRVGEAQLGGMSSEQSRAAYESGENPGGLHHGGTGPLPKHGDTESRQ